MASANATTAPLATPSPPAAVSPPSIATSPSGIPSPMASPERTPSHANTVFVGGISWKADEASLREFFANSGTVVDCKIITDRLTGKSKGYGFVTFEDAETAEQVKKSTDLFFLGKMMNVGDAYRKAEPSKRSSIGSLPPQSPAEQPPPQFTPTPQTQTTMYQYYGYQPYPYYNLGPEQFQYGYPTMYGYPMIYDPSQQAPLYPVAWPMHGDPATIAIPPAMYAMPPADDLAFAMSQMSLEPEQLNVGMRPTPVLASR